MNQPPLMVGIDGDAGSLDDVQAYREIAGLCEGLLTRLCLSGACECAVRQMRMLALEAAQLRLREQQPCGLRQVG